MRFVRSLKLLLLIAALGTGLSLVERQRRAEHGHLTERSHARGQPQLKGESLKELASVLLSLYPDGAGPNLLMGTALAEAGKLDEARAHLERALARDRRNQQLLFLYARLLLDLGEPVDKVQPVVDELRRYFPRSRQKVEEYFAQASRGEMRFAEEGVY